MLIFQALILLNERCWKILTRKLLPWQKRQEQRNSYSLNFLDAKVIIYSDLSKFYSPKNAFFLLFLKKNFFYCALRIVFLSINRISISYMCIVF